MGVGVWSFQNQLPFGLCTGYVHRWKFATGVDACAAPGSAMVLPVLPLVTESKHPQQMQRELTETLVPRPERWLSRQKSLLPDLITRVQFWGPT